MFEQFLNHIRSKSLFDTDSRVLLAVSGGVDSMVMLRLFKQAGYRIGAAHCNFGLRGRESDEDEALVKRTCVGAEIPCHTVHFSTESYARRHGLSIQVAARTLRYNFFGEVATQEGYSLIATAHHADDNIETVLINIIRGTGLDGLTGIPERNGNIIRPLLPFTRRQIVDFAVASNVEWREDASNASDYYKRNMLRKEVIPVLKQLNPNFEETFSDTLQRIRGAKLLAAAELERIRAAAVSQAQGYISIDAPIVKASVSPDVVLWELIKPYGFGYDQCRDIVSNHQSGKKFRSNRYELTVDRNTFIIHDAGPVPAVAAAITRDRKTYHDNCLTLHFEEIDAQDFTLVKDDLVAQVDLEKIIYPLELRTWKAGDRFQPLGMQTTKKVSDFLIDLKVPVPRKATVTVLESGGEIVWVIGYRISEKFKVEDHTKKVLKISALYDKSGNGNKQLP